VAWVNIKLKLTAFDNLSLYDPETRLGVVNNYLLWYSKNMRTKNSKGQFIAKRFDTKVGTIEKKYGINLGVRSDKKLGEFLQEKGYNSLAQMLKGA